MNAVVTTAVASTKSFVARHKTALTVTATATVAMALHMKVVEQHNEFLKEHDLYETFYTPEED